MSTRDSRIVDHSPDDGRDTAPLLRERSGDSVLLSFLSAPVIKEGRHAMAVEIKTLHRGDDAVLMNVAPEVFDNPVDPGLAAEFLADPRHHIVVAVDDDMVVGFASAVHYIHPDKPAELWINEVGLAQTHQRQGLGKALLKSLLDVGKTLKCTEAWVLTDRGNSAAMALYAWAGGTEGLGGAGANAPVVGYTFSLTRHLSE
jgi:aminoglycoside 6'-N-acetyltransferase I